MRLRDQTTRMAVGRNLCKFSSLVSEKLSTPLSMTLGSLDMLAGDVQRFSTEEIERVAQLARRSGQRLDQQVREILRLLDEPDRAFWETGVDLEQIDALVADLAEAMDLAKIEVHREEGLTGRLPLSPVAVELLLREVFDNARQFHPTSSPALELRLAADTSEIRRKLSLTIQNDDSTTRADQLHRFWIPYYQTEDDASIDAESVGFGISMTGTLIWGLGGTSVLEDLEAGGVAVKLVLPLVEG